MGFKSFWKSVAQIAPYVTKSADVAQAVVVDAGAVGAIVDHIQAAGTTNAIGLPSETAHADAVRVVAASADEHEARIKALEARIESLTASAPGPPLPANG